MSESFEELSARARRGELSRAEQEQLRWYLKASLEARLWHEAACQSDAEDTVLPGDHDAAQRVMQRALADLAPAQRRQRHLSVPIAAAVLLMASVAAASVAGLGYWRERKLLASPLSRHTAARRPAPPEPARVAALVEAPAASAAPVELPPLVASAVPPAPSARVRAVSEASAAASLFSAAALARREGNAVKAIALLDSLQAQYPASREARLSDLTLGALHLKRGAAPAALRHFESYSQSSPRGALAPEALWGQFQALSALRRAEEARQRLRQLVQRHPGSTYAGVARAKLDAEPRRP